MTSRKKQTKAPRTVYSGTFAGWKYAGGKTFDEAYETTVDRFYHTGYNQTTSRVYLNQRKDKKTFCSICGESESDVIFTKEAHALPACIGNRIYFTLEECDDCNARAGREWEEHLGTMTTAERALFGIPSREGSVKWTYEGKPNQVRRDSKSGLVIEVGGKDDSITVTHDEDAKTIELNGPAKPYDQVPAIKSLLHSSWFFLNEEQRTIHSYILNILLDKNIILPFVFYTGFLPDHNAQTVRLRFHELKDRKEHLPACVIQLNIGHTLLVWAAPDLKTEKYIPIPVPALTADSKAPPSAMVAVTSKDLIGARKQTRVKLQLVYESLSEPPNKKKAKKPEKTKTKSQLVSLSLKTSHYEKTLRGFFLKVKNVGTSDVRLHITNPSYPLTVVITGKRFGVGVTQKFSVDLRPGGYSLKTVEEAIKFTEKLVSKDGVLKIVWEKGEAPVCFNTPSQVAPIDFGFSKRLIKRLKEVGTALGIVFKYPKRVTEESLDDLLYLHAVLVQKRAPQLSSNLTLSFKDPLTEQQVRDECKKPDSITIQFDERSLNLFGHRATLPAHEARPIAYKINDIITKPGANEVETVTITIEGVTYV